MPDENIRTEGAKSRIEGFLTRNLECSLTLREKAAEADDDGLMRLRLSVSSETPYLRYAYYDEPWIEILGHDEKEVDLSRLLGGAPVLANHDRFEKAGNTPLSGIGVVEKAWIEKGRLQADIALSRRPALDDLRADIADGLVKNVSIGYMINERTLTRAANTKGEPDEYRVTSWTPYEISLVDIPADATVGLGRAQAPAENYRVISLSPPPSQPTTIKGTVIMEENELPPAADLSAERDRVKAIRELGRSFDCAPDADKAIDTGISVDAFRALLIERVSSTRGNIKLAETPEIGLTEKEAENYSFCRAILAASDPLHAAKVAPFELEASRAAQAKRQLVNKEREAAITIPADVLARSFSLTPGASATLRNRQHYRDLLAGTPTAGGNLVATDLMTGSFIDLLRNAMILDKLGITWLTNLSGNLAIPAQTGAASAYWVAEAGSPTESQQAIGQVAMTPKTIGAYTDYSRRLLLQASMDVETFIRADLAAIIGQGIQAAAINGTGNNNQPTGVLNSSGIGSVIGGANGAAPTYASLIALETAVATANADVGNLAFLTNAAVRGKLRGIEEFAGCGRPVWKSGSERGVGEVLGYSAVVTNAVPSGLTKGTATNCSAILFGNWADLMIGMWGGLDILLDPYTGATSGTKRVVVLQDVDVAIRHLASFAAMTDALTA